MDTSELGDSTLPNILIISPHEPGLNAPAELAAMASGARLTLLDGAVTIREVETRLRTTQYDIVHLAQHGAYGLLQFTDGLVTQERLARCLKHQDNLTLIVVNACNSAGTAALLHNEIGCAVIAHEAPISDVAAVKFSQELYAALLDRSPLHAAFDDACAALERTLPGSVQPVLINGAMGDVHSMHAEMAGLIEAFRMLRSEVGEMRRWIWRWFVVYGVVFLACVVVLALQFHL